MLRYLRIILGLGALVAVPVSALAQASIVGNIKDASGAVSKSLRWRMVRRKGK